MQAYFLSSFLASLLAALVTTTGIFVIRWFEDWGFRQVIYFSSFAAGVLISVSFLHIVPRAFTMNPIFSPAYLLAGYLFMHVLNRFITSYVCHEPLRKDYAIGLIPMLGIGLHSFVDGIIYAVTFRVGIFIGILTAVGMILHEFPEGMVTYLLLIRGGFCRSIACVLSLLAAALTTPLGVLVAYPFLRQISVPLLGIMLSFSAGCLIYVGATHLLPLVEMEKKKYSLITLITGVCIAVLIMLTENSF